MRSDIANATHDLRHDRHIECERCKNSHLLRGVFAVDVERRIRFGETALLRARKRIFEGRTFVHARQNEITRAVDDAANRFDDVARQSALQHTDDRNRAADARLESEHHALIIRRAKKLVAA